MADLESSGNPFFEHPILNSPYAKPAKHWELDDEGQPTQKVVASRRKADHLTPIPQPRKRKKGEKQDEFIFDEGSGLSTKEQQYATTAMINEIRGHVDTWRNLPTATTWGVTPETEKLLKYWRHHEFSGVRPFFCQVEAVKTLIWLTEVAPHSFDTHPDRKRLHRSQTAGCSGGARFVAGVVAPPSLLANSRDDRDRWAKSACTNACTNYRQIVQIGSGHWQFQSVGEPGEGQRPKREKPRRNQWISPGGNRWQ